MYALLYVKWTTSKDLPWSTGNFSQCYGAVWVEGESGREWINALVMVESLRCLPETITTLSIHYTPKQNWKVKKIKKKIEVNPVIVPACWLIARGGGIVDSSGFLKLKRQSWKSSETERQITGQGTRGERATQTESEQGPSHACSRTLGTPSGTCATHVRKMLKVRERARSALEESRLGANTAPPPDEKHHSSRGIG